MPTPFQTIQQPTAWKARTGHPNYTSNLIFKPEKVLNMEEVNSRGRKDARVSLFHTHPVAPIGSRERGMSTTPTFLFLLGHSPDFCVIHIISDGASHISTLARGRHKREK